jgi:hypothetical protein
MLLTLALTLGVVSNPQSSYHLDSEIDSVEYVKVDGLDFKVPVVNGWMPEKVVIHFKVQEGVETRHFYFNTKTKYEKDAKYKMPKPGIGLSEDGVETDRAYHYDLVKPR